MTIPGGLRIALAIAYTIGISAVVWLVYRPRGRALHASDREVVGLILLVMSIPFTVIGAIFMWPNIRRPGWGWWTADHVSLMFIVVLHVGFFLGVGAASPEFLGSFLLFAFPANILGVSTLVALFVASAPLIKGRREGRAIADSVDE